MDFNPKRRMHKNSIESWHEVAKPKEDANKVKIYNILKSTPRLTMHQVAEKLQLPVNYISGRFTGLKDEGYIIGDGKIKVGRAPRTLWIVTDKEFNG